MKKVYIETYGCTFNQADSDIMKGILEDSGWQITDNEDEAEVIVINTCTVKGPTENRISARIRKLAACNRKLVIAGCMSANEERIRNAAPRAPIVGTSSLARIVDALDDALEGKTSFYRSFQPKDALPRAFTAPILRIPVNDGCTSSCYFCQTKLARPYLRSFSPSTIGRWIREGVRQGAREIQITSMDTGAYGLDIKTNLGNLLDSICKDDLIREEIRIRLGMINPNHAKRLKDGIIQALKHRRMYKFIHIPVQTGSESICSKMNRDHTVADFLGLVKELREEIPEITIATDIIAGYPGETEEDHQQTVRLLREMKMDIVNVSKFSARPGTKASEMKQLASQTIKARSSELAALARSVSNEKNQGLTGKTYRVLVTERQKDFTGRNTSYKQVVVRDFQGRVGEFVDVEIFDANHGSLFGKIKR